MLTTLPRLPGYRILHHYGLFRVTTRLGSIEGDLREKLTTYNRSIAHPDHTPAVLNLRLAQYKDDIVAYGDAVMVEPKSRRGNDIFLL